MQKKKKVTKHTSVYMYVWQPIMFFLAYHHKQNTTYGKRCDLVCWYWLVDKIIRNALDISPGSMLMPWNILRNQQSKTKRYWVYINIQMVRNNKSLFWKNIFHVCLKLIMNSTLNLLNLINVTVAYFFPLIY